MITTYHYEEDINSLPCRVDRAILLLNPATSERSLQVFSINRLYRLQEIRTESNSVSFAYSPIGTVLSNEMSGYKNKEIVKETAIVPAQNNNKDDVYDSASKKANAPAAKTSNQILLATSENCLHLLIEKAKAMGANGIINLKLTTNNERGVNGYYTASGMAIKTK
ncbi:hypothetical protein [Albibacterium bauzanense]|uniref:Heavy-metal-binding protein n=1 Tax=Albibacterium bauzanense TaxID=653929 RepID=A0A4R1M2C1_9SPHI|nr:hypothetical protein [Albibacterium bauzanense]TCK85547.1 hypothetical protein C8N28_0858 [Albibacterium bauzanense]